MISGSKNVSEYTGDDINNSNRLFSEPVNFNDIGTDTLSESQRQEMIASLESALEELKSTDWDEKLREMEKMHQDMLTSLPEKIKEQQLKIQEELNKIDEETIRKQLQIAAEQMDSIRQNIDMAAIREQMQQEMQNLESQLQEQNFSEQEMRIKIEDAMKQLEKIDFNELAVNIQSTIDSIDFNFDYDFDFDIDSTLENINFKLENIDIEEIKTQVDREIKEIESQIKELKESKVQENTNN
jgi:hypothetical protein